MQEMKQFNPWVKKIPWRRKWQLTPVFFLGKPMGRGAWRATVHVNTHTRREQTEIQAKRTYQTWYTEYERNKESAMTSSFWAQSAGRMESLVPETGKTDAGGSLQVED